MSTEVLIGYPTGWTLSVVDDPAAARAAVESLASLGLREDQVLLIAGADAPARLRRLGASSSPIARFRRWIQFMAMDQLPDLFVYETAIAEGRSVIAVRVPTDRRVEVVAALRGRGAHFINSFGAWMTSEIAPWRGPMPPIPQVMQR